MDVDDDLADELREAIRRWWITHGQTGRSTTGHIEHLVDHAVLPAIRNHRPTPPAPPDRRAPLPDPVITTT